MIMRLAKNEGANYGDDGYAKRKVVLAESRRKMQAWRRQKTASRCPCRWRPWRSLFWLIWILIATVTKGFDGMSLGCSPR